MAVVNVTKTYFNDGFYGIIGLGARLGEDVFQSPVSPGFGKPNATFPTLYDQLQAHGYTARRAFSIWLNSISATTGRIIFGGLDTAKYHDELISVPVQLSQGMFFDWRIILTSVIRCSAGHGHSKEEVLTAPDVGITVNLDSGSPNMYLPWTLAQNISSAMKASTQFGFPYVPCSQRNVDSTLDFGFGDASGPRISVPYSALIYPYGAPSNIGPVTASDGTRLCYLGVIGVNGTIFLLGDTFIRSAYLVYDVDNLQVAMAQARYNVDEENIVEIVAGTNLPGVSKTASYSLPTPSKV